MTPVAPDMPTIILLIQHPLSILVMTAFILFASTTYDLCPFLNRFALNGGINPYLRDAIDIFNGWINGLSLRAY